MDLSCDSVDHLISISLCSVWWTTVMFESSGIDETWRKLREKSTIIFLVVY
jgi:hypothetical protein